MMKRTPWYYHPLAMLLSMLSGVLFAFALPPRDFSLLGWVAFLPLLVACRLTNRVLVAAFCGMLVSATCAGVMAGRWESLGQYGNLVAAFGGLGLVFAFVASLACFGAKRLSLGWWAVFVAAAAVTAELLSTQAFPVNVALCQHHSATMLRLASVTGVWGVSALLWLVPGALIAVMRSPRAAWPALALVLALMTAGLVPQPRNTGDKVGLAAIQAQDLDDAVTQTHKAAPHAKIVVWPEYTSRTRNRCAYTAAKDTGLYVVANYHEQPRTGRPYNVAHVISPSGRRIATFRKQHLFGKERFVYAAGKPRDPVAIGKLRVGVPICFDTEVPGVVRQLVRDGANVILVPNSDPWLPNGLFNYLHTALMPFRAAENGVPMAWSEHSGLSTIIDGDGTTLMQAPLHKSMYVAAEVAPRTRRTFFTFAGDYFAYLCAAGLAFMVVLCWKKTNPRTP